MKRSRIVFTKGLLSALLGLGGMNSQQTAYGAETAKAKAAAAVGTDEIPTFRYDPDWPKPLPNAWIFGIIGALYADKDDHIWVAQRPASTTPFGERDVLEGKGDCCTPAPPVMEFDT